jgi:hypothetical protein
LYAQKLYHPDLSGSTRFFILLVVDHGVENCEEIFAGRCRTTLVPLFSLI